MMNKMFAGLVIGILIMSSVAFADIPKYISVQGKLTNLGDEPYTVSKKFIFKLFDYPTGAGPIYESPEKTLNLDNGVFNTMIGPIDKTFDIPYYLEIWVDGTVLTPRVDVTSSGYAYTSERMIGGGKSGETVGIWQYNSANQNRGLFYTDGTYDVIDISPNGGGGTAAADLRVWSTGEVVARTALWAPRICLSGDCKTAWPTEGSGLTCASCNAGTLVTTGGLSVNGNVDVGGAEIKIGSNLRKIYYGSQWGGKLGILNNDAAEGLLVGKLGIGDNYTNANAGVEGLGGNSLWIKDNIKSTGLTVGSPNGLFVFDSSTSTSGYTTTFRMNNTGLYIGHNSNVRDLELGTNGLTRLSIAPGGDVSIGNNLAVTGGLTVGGNQIPSQYASYEAYCQSDGDWSTTPSYYVPPAGTEDCQGGYGWFNCPDGGYAISGGCACLGTYDIRTNYGGIKNNKIYGPLSAAAGAGWMCKCSGTTGKIITLLCAK